MSFPGLPDLREKTFDEGLRTFDQAAAERFWDPRQGVWFSYSPTEYIISSIPDAPLADLTFKDAAEKYQAVEQSWQAIKDRHRDAFFSLKDKQWRTVTKLGKTGDDLAERERKARIEIEAAEQQFKAGVMTAEELAFKIKEIRRKYKLD